jgi:hypothetical protein
MSGDSWEGSFGLTLNITNDMYNYTDSDVLIATLIYDKEATLTVDWSETEEIRNRSTSKFLYFR